MGELIKPYGATPEKWETIEVAPGVFWIALPLPYPPGYVNVYLHQDGESWTLIDTGMNTSSTREAWEQLFKTALGGKPISRLICTHSHEDHMGLAHWLQEKHPAELWTTQGEWLFGMAFNGKGWGLDATDFYLSAGTGRQIAAQINTMNHPYGTSAGPAPCFYHRVRENDVIAIGKRDWRVITGFGHSQEHLCLYCEALNILISGDIILTEICPALSIFPNEPEEDPIHDYLSALPKFKDLPEDTLVLPAHGLPFKGLHARIEAKEAYYAKNLEKILEACATPISAGHLVTKLYPQRKHPGNQFLALSEILSSLNHLRKRDKIKRTQPKNVWLFQTMQ